MKNSLTIFHKGLLLIAVPLLLQIVFLFYLVVEQRNSVREQEAALRSKDVLEAADRLERTLLDAADALRSFQLTRDQRFRMRFEEKLGEIEPRIYLVRQLIEEPEQKIQFAKVEQTIASSRIALKQSLEAGPAQSLAVAPFERAREPLDEFRAAEKKLDREHVMTVRSTARRIIWVLSIGLVIVLMAAVMSVAIFSGHITRRLARLSENVNLFLRGRPLPSPMHGTDELSRMDHIFQAMATSIGDSARKEELYKLSLEKRAAALGEANAELRLKSDENEMFVYSVSHDLRSPLVNLQGFSRELGLVSGDLQKLLQREGVPPPVRNEAEALLEGDMAESLKFIQQGVTRLANIIDALLRLSRAGRVEYFPEVISLDAIARAVVSTLEGTRAEKGATIQIHPLPEAWCDPSAAEQVMANCVGNALNYLDPIRPGHIEIGSLPPDSAGKITFFIKDNGLGIEDAYLPKVFMVFQRLHGNAAPGEGIGLALVRRVLERNGGRIWVESRAGEGSTFFVELPSVTHSPDEVHDTRKATLAPQ